MRAIGVWAWLFWNVPAAVLTWPIDALVGFVEGIVAVVRSRVDPRVY